MDSELDIKTFIPVEKCSSCGACFNVCPRSAISLQLDKEGFYRPIVDKEKCIKCGLCERSCPWKHHVTNPNGAEISPRTIAAYAHDEKIRMQSSSGGLFTIMAECILEQGGVVVGVAQQEKDCFKHIIVESKDKLDLLRGSKYVQANVGLIYQNVRNLLKKGRKVLFSGTPCQIAALYSFLGNTVYSNLYTLDIVCHGVPSMNVFRKYLHELECLKKANLKRTFFRDKISGWTDYSLKHEFEFGKTLYVRNSKSAYLRLFVNKICLNSSCEDCHYRKLPRIADITLGDFWGVKRFHSQMDDNKGTSVVLLNNSHGESLFNLIKEKLNWCESNISNAIAFNPNIAFSCKEHPKRELFFKNLGNYTLNALAKMYCPNTSLFNRILSRMKKKLNRV